ncbi:MAG: site-specific DNA-methyltransferase [Leptospirales bacterium]
MDSTIYLADCFEYIKQMESESVDLVIADGPYAVTTHDWDKIKCIQDFNLNLIKELSRIMKPGAGLYLFGKHDAIDFIDYREYMKLNTRIVWYQPSRLAQGRTNYTDNYDVIYYFSKGKANSFNLDDIRVPQLVELAHRKRCENVPSVKNGKFKKTRFNPKGKNPGNVWGDIKQLTYKSGELLSRSVLNTIQKPEKLIERLIKASSKPGDLIFDPFAGTGTAMKIGARLGRKTIGCELNPELALAAYYRTRDVTDAVSLDFRYSAGLVGRNTVQA